MKRKDIVEKKPLKTGGAWNAMKAGWAVGKTKGPIDAVNAWKGIRKGVEKVGSEKPKTKPAPGKPTAVKPKPTANVATPKPAPGKPTGPQFPTSKQGYTLQKGDTVTYTNSKGQQKTATVDRMLKTKDKQNELQIGLTLKGANYSVSRNNINAVNGKPWDYDPSTGGSKPVESVTEGIDARIQHAEDLIFQQGSAGAIRALVSLKGLAQGGHKNVSLKWDGSPAVIFGRDENGEFIFTDKTGFGAVKTDGRAKDPDQLKDILLSRGGGKMRDDPKRVAFASNMASIMPLFEKATPKDVRGFFKGDLLYYTTPPVKNGNYVFKPQIVEYAVDVNSDLGKKIGASKTGIVIHRFIDDNDRETPVKDYSIFQGNDVLVVPPVTTEKAPEVPNEELDRLEALIKKDKSDIDSLLDKNKLAQQKMGYFPEVLYRYMNSKVDTGLDNLGKDFIKWLSDSKLSNAGKNKVTEYVKANMRAFTSLWEVVEGIMKAKDSVIDSLDKQSSGISQSIGGQKGGEGYVLANPDGDIKLVPRASFSKANRAVQR
jgi:hypothetical protein